MEISKPPLNLLLNPDYIRRRRPWELDLEELLNLLLKVLKEKGIDLRLAGTAALNSTLIYRLKVESFFLFEKLKEKSFPITKLDLPTLTFPFRFEYSYTSIEDLIEAFRLIIESSKVKRKEKLKVKEMEPIINLDTFQIYLKKALDEFREKILELLKFNKFLKFSDLIRGKDLLEAIRNFLLLLFLATEGLIILEDVEEDILIWKK